MTLEENVQRDGKKGEERSRSGWTPGDSICCVPRCGNPATTLIGGDPYCERDLLALARDLGVAE